MNRNHLDAANAAWKTARAVDDRFGEPDHNRLRIWAEVFADGRLDNPPLAAQATARWYTQPRDRSIQPGDVIATARSINRETAEQANTARVTGRSELQHTIDADTRRNHIHACHLCDDHGWITGRQTSDDGITRDATIRCEHTNRPLPAGFTPEPTSHGPRRAPKRNRGIDPQVGLPIAGADGEPIWDAYEEHGAIYQACPTCKAQPREGCINVSTGADRLIPCTSRLTLGHRAAHAGAQANADAVS